MFILCRHIFLTTIIFFAPTLFAGSLTVIPLNLPSGAMVQSLNNNGEVAGIFSNAPFVATADSFSVQALPAGVGQAFTVFVNDSGVIGGEGIVPAEAQAFIGDAALPFTNGDTAFFVTGLNDAGQLAGYVQTAADGVNAAIATTGGTSALTSSDASFFFGINSSGIATGRDVNDQAIFGTTSGVTTIPLAPGFTSMEGQGINASGHICGDNLAFSELFYFDGSTTTMIPLPTGATGAELPEGQCISDSNQVLFTSFGSTGAAFLWDPVNGLQALSTLTPGWTITSAVGISSDGDILAFGTNGTFTGPVLLTVAPEPSATPLVGATLIGLGIYLRRRGFSASSFTRS
jgi:hypothetical protein